MCKKSAIRLSSQVYVIHIYFASEISYSSNYRMNFVSYWIYWWRDSWIMLHRVLDKYIVIATKYAKTLEKHKKKKNTRHIEHIITCTGKMHSLLAITWTLNNNNNKDDQTEVRTAIAIKAEILLFVFFVFRFMRCKNKNRKCVFGLIVTDRTSNKYWHLFGQCHVGLRFTLYVRVYWADHWVLSFDHSRTHIVCHVDWFHSTKQKSSCRFSFTSVCSIIIIVVVIIGDVTILMYKTIISMRNKHNMHSPLSVYVVYCSLLVEYIYWLQFTTNITHSHRIKTK